MNIKNKGQVFTSLDIVNFMWSLSKNNGLVLEPSCADGFFLKNHKRDIIGIEKYKAIANQNALVMDFFKYPISNKFNTIIGNPPYVRYNDIVRDTRDILDLTIFDKRTNLYLFFIEKCCKHLREGGELIFITPRDFIKLTCSKKLNTFLYENGSITFFKDIGDKQIFKDVCPNVAIWRWVKGITKHRNFYCQNGQIYFKKINSRKTLGDYFNVKVGAVSGANEIFTNKEHGNVDFVFSKTRKTGKLKKMIYRKEHKCLLKHKESLINRKIKKFNESNWWDWGRAYPQYNQNRIYVNFKTRNKEPFFISDCNAFEGAVLALIPKDNNKNDLPYWNKFLNGLNWEKLGFNIDGRNIFGQRTLATLPV